MPGTLNCDADHGRRIQASRFDKLAVCRLMISEPDELRNFLWAANPAGKKKTFTPLVRNLHVSPHSSGDFHLPFHRGFSAPCRLQLEKLSSSRGMPPPRPLGNEAGHRGVVEKLAAVGSGA